MHRWEEEILEGNYTTDFSPYATQVVWLDHFLLAYISVIFFSYVIFLADVPKDLKHECLMFLMWLHHLSLVSLLVHLCHHLELTIHPWWLPYQCLQFLQSWAETQVRTQKGLSTQGPTRPDMKLAYCWRFGGALYDSLKSASTTQKRSVESNFEKNSRQVLQQSPINHSCRCW